MLAAIGITTAMDAGRLAAFSAFPLFPLMGLFWYLQRFSRADVGFVWGKPRHYGLAVLFPLAVLSVTAFVATMAGVASINSVRIAMLAFILTEHYIQPMLFLIL